MRKSERDELSDRYATLVRPYLMRAWDAGYASAVAVGQYGIVKPTNPYRELEEEN